jgi:ATP-dependent Clp protease protease subunit
MREEKLYARPNVIKESANGYNLIGIADEFLDNREIYMTDEVNVETSKLLLQQLRYLDKKEPGKPVTLFINSPGGDVYSGLAVYDYMRMMKSPVTTCCIGRAASMAAILFLAADTRLIMPHSEIMIHDASFGQAEFSGLKPAEIQEKTDSLKATSKILRDIVTERTGQSPKWTGDRMMKDSYFKAEEAVKYGLATAIVKEEI